MDSNMKLRSEIIELGQELARDIDHAECFYEKDLLDEFCANLEKMRRLAVDYYYSNQEEE